MQGATNRTAGRPLASSPVSKMSGNESAAASSSSSSFPPCSSQPTFGDAPDAYESKAECVAPATSEDGKTASGTEDVFGAFHLALPPLITLTLDELRRRWRTATHAPLPTSLDECSVGVDERRPLRDDERDWPVRLFMFAGEPTAYAHWLTRRVVADRDASAGCSWRAADVVNGLLWYETRTAVMIVRELAAVDATVLDYLVKRLSRNRRWRAYARALTDGGAFTERDVARLETEADRVDAELVAENHEGKATERKAPTALPDVMAAAIVETFFSEPASLLCDTLLTMQRGGMSVSSLIARRMRDNPAGADSRTLLGRLKVLLANGAFSTADRDRIRFAYDRRSIAYDF